jgi:hypothetical protein
MFFRNEYALQPSVSTWEAYRKKQRISAGDTSISAASAQTYLQSRRD